MNKARRAIAALVLSILANRFATAAVELPAVFGDHMVIQQGKPVLVWGKANAGELVVVELAGERATANADTSGRFSVELPPLTVAKNTGPQELTVSASNTVRIRDVLVGEVWICSGQSNMRLPLKECTGGTTETANAKFDRIRILSVPDGYSSTPQFTFKSRWAVCSPQTIGGFSGAGYFFAKEMHRALDVPVGVIDSSLGWSPGEAWVPTSVLESSPITKPIIDRQRGLAGQFESLESDYQKQLALWKAHRSEIQAKEKANPAGTTQPADDLGPRPRRVFGIDPRLRPSEPYNAMMAPLIPFRIAGVVWYQGETNAVRAEQYRTLLPLLIAHYRKMFQSADLPFGIVQLPNHVNKDVAYDTSWAEMRESQLLTHRAVPHTGLIVTFDIGESNNIHPGNKRDVGARLAKWALTEVYGRPGEPSGPLFKSAAVDSGSIKITFDHADSGLLSREDELKGFTIAGEDRNFVPANAKIEGKQIVISSPSVSKPVAVRYAWGDDPVGTLMNGSKLPASPFRTDDWPLKTAGVLTTDWQ